MRVNKNSNQCYKFDDVNKTWKNFDLSGPESKLK